MIVICEPQCKGLSHEKVNSGFIYGLRLAYPEEKIRFYADNSHIQAIKNILENDRIIIENIGYSPIKFYDDPYSFRGMITYYSLIKKVFANVLSAGANKIFFLSMNPILLYVIKRLKTKTRFHNVQCTIVLHGELEGIAYNKYMEFPRSIFDAAPSTVRSAYPLLFKKMFHIKKTILWRHSNDYRYIVMSPHIIPNAEKYLDVKNLNFHTIVMPVVFAKPMPPPCNKYVKFAIFGYGDIATLNRIALLLSQKKIKNPYEIRIIGMENRGTDVFPNIQCVSPGKAMQRKEMEKSAQDIDMFLILYEKNRYRLSCSASILEALSYMKPILYLTNDSVNNFNKPENPIGYCCGDPEEFADKMSDIVENYSAYQPELQTFRNNMLKLREEFAIENLAPKIKSSFTFDIKIRQICPNSN